MLDFGYDSGAFDPFYFMTRLPTMAAVAHHLGPDQLDDVEAYAAGDYLADLLRGDRDSAALARISARVATITGLDPALVQRRHGRITTPACSSARTTSRTGASVVAYDVTQTIPRPISEYETPEFPDPIMSSLGPPVTSAIIDLINNRLGWHPDGDYELGNMRVFHQWQWATG